MGTTDQRGHKQTPPGTARSLGTRVWLVTIVVLSLILAACGTNSAAQLNPTQAKELLIKAYRDTIATGGYTVRATIHETLGRETLKDTRLSGLVTTDPPAARLELPTPQGGTQEQLTIGDTQYTPAPSTSHSDHVTKWLAFAIPPQAALVGTDTSNSKNTLAPLPFLINPAIGQIHEIGQAQVNGTPTFEFQTQVRERLEEPPPVPSSGNSIGPPITKVLTHVILSVWVTRGTKPLIKQLEIAQQAKPHLEKLTTTTMTTLSGYGAKPPITPPPIASVTTLSSIIGSSNAQGQTSTALQTGASLAPNPILNPIRTFANNGSVLWSTAINDDALVLEEAMKGHNVLERIDPATGAIEAHAELSTLEAMTYAGGELVTTTPGPKGGTTIEVLNPDTLSMLYQRTIQASPNRAANAASIAVVDGRIWVSTTTGIVGFNTDLRHLKAITIAHPETLSIEVAAYRGTALFTSLCSDGGSAITIEVRNPTNGHLLSSFTTQLAGIGGAAMTPTPTRLWLHFATGMLGSIGFVDLTPTDPPTLAHAAFAPSGTGSDDRSFSNDLGLDVIGSSVFAYDKDYHLLECRNVETGALLATTQNLKNVQQIVGLSNHELAAIVGSNLVIAKAGSACLG
ncbi:MAG: hypothetical protein ACP5HZ_11745 [Ferrimicrobium sp.]